MAHNTGRWTNEEHGKFLRGLELYGKRWKKLAMVVGSRSTVQVRSHAQKYFQNMASHAVRKSKTQRVQVLFDGGGAQDPNQDISGCPGMPGGGLSRPHQRQRINLDSKQIQGTCLSVPPPLLAFVPAGTMDIAAGLYTFLSPESVPSGDTSSSAHCSTDSERTQPFSRGGNLPVPAASANNNNNNNNGTSGLCHRNSVPDWFGKVSAPNGDACTQTASRATCPWNIIVLCLCFVAIGWHL